MQNEIYYIEKDNQLFIKASGHITANICFGLRQKVFSRIEHQPMVTAIYADLSECEYMDSTFMGLLIGFNKKLLSQLHKKLCVIHPSKESQEHLTDLGLDKILGYCNTEVDFPDKMDLISQKDSLPPEFVLKAHEDLIEISEENKSRFKLVKDILAKKLRDQS
ncbi:MAG: STAS domain-containing protein [Spirochaetales bacterium]|nr:STAS domain-containing protein [Spirochaetales bacterium]